MSKRIAMTGSSNPRESGYDPTFIQWCSVATEQLTALPRRRPRCGDDGVFCELCEMVEEVYGIDLEP